MFSNWFGNQIVHVIVKLKSGNEKDKDYSVGPPQDIAPKLTLVYSLTKTSLE